MNQNNTKILIANPYNDRHIALIKAFEEKLENHLPVQTSDILLKIREQQTEEEYFQTLAKSNVVEENIYLVEDGELKSSCYIEGNKQEKRCTFSYTTPSVYQNKGYGGQMLEKAYEYATTLLEMDTVELDVAKQNKASRRLARKAGFKKVGEYGMSDIYAKSTFDKDRGNYSL